MDDERDLSFHNRKYLNVAINHLMEQSEELQKELVDQLNKLDDPSLVDPPERPAKLTREVAKLQALSSQSSSATVMAAARVVADAFDRNTEAGNQSHNDTIWWQRIAVGISLVVVIAMVATSPWCAPRPPTPPVPPATGTTPAT